MLEVADLHAYYGKSHILQGVDMHIDKGEVVSLLRSEERRVRAGRPHLGPGLRPHHRIGHA